MKRCGPGHMQVDHASLRGQRFGMLTATGAPGRVNGRRGHIFACDCGNETVQAVAVVRRGLTVSCGCKGRRGRQDIAEANRTHGRSNTTEHNIWTSMKQRCSNPRAISFRYYGARGITVCDRWRDSFEAFLADMGPRPPGTSIDRIDNNGNYEPGNCRWATDREQNSNRRNCRKVSWHGVTASMREWAERTGLGYDMLRLRFRAGWDVERALTTPARVLERRR